MIGVRGVLKGAWRAIACFALATALVGIQSPSTASASIEGCPDFTDSCPCPAGCNQGYCERACLAFLRTETRCGYKCGACQCSAWAGMPGRSVLGLMRCFSPSASAQESGGETPNRRRDISNPDGDFVIMPKAEAARLGGENGGIGISIRQSNASFVIAGVEIDSPASKAGLTSGDEILQVDGKRLRGGSLQSIAEWIRGRPGTMVSLTLRRKNGKKMKVSLLRVSREGLRRHEEPEVTAKTVSISEFKGASCPKTLDGCNFLVMEDGSCIFTCRRNK